MKKELKIKLVVWSWRPLATADDFGRPLTTIGALLTTMDDHRRPLATIGDHWPSRMTICKRNGSALIMTIVLTALLAIAGVVFVLMARMEKTAVSSRSDSEQLKLAVDSVVTDISQRLANDMPRGGDPNRYYDYPGRWYANGLPNVNDANDAWLANLEPEPNVPGVGYRWRHISTIYKLNGPNDVNAYAYFVPAKIVNEYPSIPVNLKSSENLADADGDGVADSRWLQVPDLSTSKGTRTGKRVYAAVRIVDNGGMLNVNTAYKFDPTAPGTNGAFIDGNNPMQINLLALAGRDHTNTNLAGRLFSERVNATGISNSPPAPNDVAYWNYANKVVWPLVPTGSYTPFDLSDELKLRNRYMITGESRQTRTEFLWTNAFYPGAQVPVGSSSSAYTLSKWFGCVDFNSLNANDYDYRHIATTYNMERLIDPHRRKMVWINDPDQNAYARMVDSIDPCLPSSTIDKLKDEYAQVAANMKAYGHADANVPVLNANSKTYYGLARPFIYISEVARYFVADGGGTVHRSYALELTRQVTPGEPPISGWQLVIDSPTKTIVIDSNSFLGSNGQFYVAEFRDNQFPPDDLNQWFIERRRAKVDSDTISVPVKIFDTGSTIKLTRKAANGDTLVMDSVQIPAWLADDTISGYKGYQRDNNYAGRLIQRLWDPNSNDSVANTLTLGSGSAYIYSGNLPQLQAFASTSPFANVGDVGLMFKKPAYYVDGTSNTGVIGYDLYDQNEVNVRVNLADPNVQRIFQYITAFNPPDALGRVKGRININTAPWYVIKQLPWVGLRNSYDANSLAQAITAYRDKLSLAASGPDYSWSNDPNSRYRETGIAGLNESPGFRSIGELTSVINNESKNDYSMWYYMLGNQTGSQIGYPDLTPDDVKSDFEKRNLIFARISDLVTVRSDVFTAYILVRLGDNGPQRRIVAIFDRSSGSVKVVAIQPVGEAR